MQSLIWILIFIIFIATLVGLIGKFVRMFNAGRTQSTASPELDLGVHMMVLVMLGLQIAGGVSVVMISWFVAMAAGGLDILEYDPPGLNATCMILPLALPLTLISYIGYVKLKERQFATALLIVTAIVNVVLTIQLTRYWNFHLR